MKSAHAFTTSSPPVPSHPGALTMVDAPSRTISVAVVEGDLAIRESLRALVGLTSELWCVGVFANISTAASQLPRLRPDVLLLDARLLARNQMGLIADLKAGSPGTQILILTTFDLGALTFDSVCEGASGDLPKTTPSAELVQAVKWVHAGGSLMSMPLARRVAAHLENCSPPHPLAAVLTNQEKRAVAALARGVPYAAAADELGVGGVPAVLTLLRGIYAKFSLQERVT